MADNRLIDNYIFSFVVFIDVELGLTKFVNSIKQHAYNIPHDIEILIMDPICSTETTLLGINLEGTYPDVKYYSARDMSLAQCYNYGLIISKGVYINFTLSSSYLGDNAIEAVYRYMVKHKYPRLVAMAPWTVNENEILSQYRNSPRLYNGFGGGIKLTEKNGGYLTCLNTFFIKRYLIITEASYEKFYEFGNDTAINYILRLFSDTKRFDYVSYAFYNYTIPLDDNTSAYLGQYDKSWYLDDMEANAMSIISPYIERQEAIPQFIQRALVWVVFSRLNCNYNDRNKKTLSNDEIKEFYKKAGSVLSYIDNRFIWTVGNGQNYKIPRIIRMLMFNIKASYEGNEVKILISGNNLMMSMEDKGVTQCLNVGNKETYVDTTGKLPEIKKVPIKLMKLVSISKEDVLIDIINYKNGIFEIDARCSLGDFMLYDDISIFLKSGEKEYPVDKVDIYSDVKMFGESINKKLRFRVDVNEYLIDDVTGVSFYVRINDAKRKLQIKIASIYAHISKEKDAYWRYSDASSYMYINENTLYIKRTNEEELQKKEMRFEKCLARKGNEQKKRSLVLRKIYFDEIKVKSKPIWITFDKLYKAGDNGEYIFRYITQNVSDVDMYYLIKEDSPDYERLLDEYGDHILVWGRDETVVKMLLADVILGTHANILSNAGIEKGMIPYLADLFDPIHVCIQHGLTVQDIAQFQNKLFDNIRLYLLASRNEWNNICNPLYGYTKDMLSIPGIARYDGLKSKPQKQILITPTWRRSIANSNIAHFKKAHNEYFHHSDYFKIYNKLINDLRLIEIAKEYGYRIIYLLHPAVSSQIDDFDRNDFVDIIPAAGDMNYEKILTESDLMVTDYSGIQFDFAYMKKPILYYHPVELPPHYTESSAYRYKKHAFGPIITDYEDLVSELCAYMQDGCKMRQLYVERVNAFFEHHDHNNCERIYKAVSEFASS